MRHVLITGSTRGIGFAIASEFLQQGFAVTLNGTTEVGLAKALDALRSRHAGARVQGFRADMADRAQVFEMARKAVSGQGPLDIWVNNAGVNQRRAKVSELGPEEIGKVFHINVAGVINGCQAALAIMETQPDGGFIFNMEGLGSDGMILPRTVIYGTSKRALRYLSHGLSRECEGSKVRVGTISPGMVLTDFILKPVGQEEGPGEAGMRIFAILADWPETVARYLVRKMALVRKNGARIAWLGTAKIFLRFLMAPLRIRAFKKELSLRTSGF